MMILQHWYKKDDAGVVLVHIRLELRHGKLFREWGVTKMIRNCDYFSIEITRSGETYSVLLSVPSNVISCSTRLLTSYMS